MSTATKFWVLHDYGTEGWAIVDRKDCATILEAVELRESHLANAGGTVVVVEVIDVIDAYRRADYEREALKRKAQS